MEEEGGRRRAKGRRPQFSSRRRSSADERERSGGGEEERREGERSFVKEKQELRLIFVRTDSEWKQEKLAESTERDEKPSEADSYRSGFKRSQPNDWRSDGQKNSGRRGATSWKPTEPLGENTHRIH